MRRHSLLLACLAVSSTASQAYIRSRNSAGAQLRCPDFSAIQFLVHDRTAPGLTNSSGGVTITADSDPLGALQAAMDAWTSVPTSSIVFNSLTLTPIDTSQGDRLHLITLADTPGNRSIVGDAVAVTRTFTDSGGNIVDSDIVFNPILPFSTTLQSGTFDLQTVATHELGHALGASHSGVLTATMFFAVRRASNLQGTLSPDDVAFANEVYPENGVTQGLASITGSVTLSAGGPVRGALVTAVDPGNGVVIGSITGADGAYAITDLPPGRYFVYAEPADGPVAPDQLAAAGQGANTNFSTAVLGGAGTPQAVTLGAGATAAVNLTVEGGNPALNIRQAGSGPVGGSIPFGSGGLLLNRGATADMVLAGDGLDDASITADSISFFGAPIVIQGQVRRATASGSNLPVLRFTVQVSPSTALGLHSVMVRTGAGTSVYSGGIRVGPPAPSFPANGVVSGASFLAGALAPGEIVSIFGTNLGPAAGVIGQFVPGTGRLTTSLGGVSVMFNGSRAPLFFVSSGQINAQVPFEMAGQSSANVVVTYEAAASAPVSVRIGAAQPAIFVRPGTSQGIIQHVDGSLNGAGNAVARGQAVVVYATGQGTVNPALATGAPAAASPLSGATQPVQAFVGGKQALVLFGGMTPQFVGLLQVNLVVPNDAPAGPNVPITINVGGVDSQPNVTMAVR